ncbi:MAG: nucleotidyltransferase domain-containing protein [Candidatus Saccharibacteria bacterium]|nr:nucleotidyltransferase domain-containing protein [Candidatus Saccharibacteria bacterium]
MIKNQDTHDQIFKTALKEIPALHRLYDQHKIDLAIITGSFSRGHHDDHSDIDLFVIVPYAAEVEENLLIEYSFMISIDGSERKVEISFVTTERLERERTEKCHIFWWHDAVCVYSRTPYFEQVLNELKNYTEEELKDKFATLNFQFKLGELDLRKSMKRNEEDELGRNMIYYDCLRIFMELILLSQKTLRRFTGFTTVLMTQNKELYSYLNVTPSSFQNQLEILSHLGTVIDKILLENGFSPEEVDGWDRLGLPRLIFQK